MRPNGNGTVNINSNWNITGSLNATGNIQTSGNFTLGNDDEDNVTFVADINSDIIPDQTNTSDLGGVSKQWLNMYSTLLNGEAVQLDELIVGSGDSSLARRQGNTFYVSTLGSNSNVGDHQHGAFRTLKHALAQVDGSTAGPTVIHVFPGEYEEEFPLTVPSHVNIKGEDIRNTIIRPTVATQSNNAFLLEDDVVIEDITIKDFFSPGHAFSFTSGGLVNTRSPYIRNVTVITKGSVTSAADPRGFAQGDAGKGALIDGATLDSASLEASMLFHSVTFITPGVDAITMTNGVRVEWLNSFTYFAKRGMYAVRGSTGRTAYGTTNYGAELRSIGSANVYGTKGAECDGADTLMYLIQHNMAYIGAGKFVDNDPSRVIQTNEITELNSGKIHFVTTDQGGSFRIGDNFFVDFETGNTTISIDDLSVNQFNALRINTGTSTTVIDGAFIDTGNLRIQNNIIQTDVGDLIIESAGKINLNDNTNVTGDVDITGNFSYGGALNVKGNELGDALVFNAELQQNFNPV